MVRLEVRLGSVLFHKGHDGFLRGKPEPVLLLGAYSLGSTARFLGKTRIALTVAAPFPCTSEVDTSLVKAKLQELKKLAILCLAFEEDAGSDIEPIAADLEDMGAWSLRTADSGLAAPFALPELDHAPWAVQPRGHQVHVVHAGRELGDRTAKGDDWVGAGLLVLEPGPRRRDCSLRIASANGRNDWELQIAVWLR
jgi:hypothetical protein